MFDLTVLHLYLNIEFIPELEIFTVRLLCCQSRSKFSKHSNGYLIAILVK